MAMVMSSSRSPQRTRAANSCAAIAAGRCARRSRGRRRRRLDHAGDAVADERRCAVGGRPARRQPLGSTLAKQPTCATHCRTGGPWRGDCSTRPRTRSSTRLASPRQTLPKVLITAYEQYGWTRSAPSITSWAARLADELGKVGDGRTAVRAERSNHRIYQIPKFSRRQRWVHLKRRTSLNPLQKLSSASCLASPFSQRLVSQGG